jgi:acyl-CoA thioester hydrolase
MPRIKINTPTKFHFTCDIPVRITDMNYGGHLGNDAVLTLLHEARIQFLAQLGYTEMNIDGLGLIITDAAISYKAEIFYGDKITISMALTEWSKIGFELVYHVEKLTSKPILCTQATTSMLFYDYSQKKIGAITPAIQQKFEEITR